MSEHFTRRAKGRREPNSWRRELHRQMELSKGSFAGGGLPRTIKAQQRTMPSMPVFNLPALIEDEPK